MVHSIDEIFSGAVESLINENESLAGDANQWFSIHQAFLAFIVSSFSDLSSVECRRFCFCAREFFLVGREIDMSSALHECRSIVSSRKRGSVSESTHMFDSVVWRSLKTLPDRDTNMDFLYHFSDTMTGVEMAGVPEIFVVDTFNMFFYSGTYKRFESKRLK